ncbi:IMPACT family protein [Geomonas sp. Red32]|uniref:IMPACT family protein n=1 Tax=Geomonas sp. Red32 TaxID=2912856 RepID=UPI00202CBBFC|nr:IMPACT family protein [Geomonas sp. Red32]
MTVQRDGQAEIIVKKSRFIVNAAPVRSELEAMGFVERIRAEHRDANHNCFAFKAGGSQRMSDDGEPSGTAGRPILDVLEKQGLSDTVIVVTRYFGGILLGAAGLVRAYSQSAAAGVEAAGVATAVAAVDLRVTLEYPLVGKVQYLLTRAGALTLDSHFGEKVSIACRVLAGAAEALENELAEASAGRIDVKRVAEVLVGNDLQPIHGDAVGGGHEGLGR